ncbi:MAG: hypothetical protein ACPG47_05595, partial [Leucothrix sp.]
MSENRASGITFLLPAGSSSRGTPRADKGKVLPKVLGGTTRSGETDRNPFINDRVIDVDAVF